jgi:hypothetical protein
MKKKPKNHRELPSTTVNPPNWTNRPENKRRRKKKHPARGREKKLSARNDSWSGTAAAIRIGRGVSVVFFLNWGWRVNQNLLELAKCAHWS